MTHRQVLGVTSVVLAALSMAVAFVTSGPVGAAAKDFACYQTGFAVALLPRWTWTKAGQ